MKTFEWSTPTTVDEAVRLLKADAGVDPDDAPRPLAGGQDLLTTMKDYVTRPTRLVNLKGIRGLDRVEGTAAKGLHVGALVTLAALEEHPEVRAAFPGLAEAAGSVASPQIRNLGTVGGNLCQRPRCWYFRLENVVCIKKGGDTCYAAAGQNKYNAIFGGGPSYIVHPSDLAPMLAALGASARIRGPRGERTVALGDFFTLPSQGNVRRENVLANDEILLEVTLPPAAAGLRSTYLKFKEKESMDFAMSAVAAAGVPGPNGSLGDVRIVLGGVAPVPWRAAKAEAYVSGRPLTPEVLAETARLALDGAEPLEHNAYKVPLTQTLVRRALARLAGKTA
jgi:xanthine dehydrogenase YagS FAD-binding subunit